MIFNASQSQVQCEFACQVAVFNRAYQRVEFDTRSFYSGDYGRGSRTSRDSYATG